MNNSQFRKLVLDTPARQAGSNSTENKPTARRDGATPSTLGSRMRSSIPMTPRSIATSGGVDFARQLAERNSSAQPQKKFRSSAAPKGAKLPSGYTDRTQGRLGADDEDEGDEDDKTKRVKALEEMMKLQQIDEDTFVKLRDEILEDAGVKERAGLVKGLDWKLLERVRRGEKVDVLGGEQAVGREAKEDNDEGDVNGEDVDDEFEKLEEREIQAVEKQKADKKGEMAPPSLIPGKKRNRDQILAEMKAARQAAKEASQPSLGSRFKKVGGSKAGSRIERDSKGREVLITIDEDGNEKRKVRKVQLEEELEKGNGLLMPDRDAKPLGMEVPELLKPTVEDEEDIDIFDDAGDDYNPLAGLSDGDESDAEESEVSENVKGKKSGLEVKAAENTVPGSMGPPPRPKQPPASRNYFGDSQNKAIETEGPKAFSDPTILAALKRASNLNPISKAAENEEEAAKEARRKKMLQQDDRDAEDMDMGFGSSRFADEEDFEEKKVKLSEWGRGGDDDEGGKGEGKSKRKRGPKKRKGDGNNPADVMKVLERRKAADS